MEPVSQHVFTVEVFAGEESVLLPCRIYFVPPSTTVTWRRTDLDPPTVHRRVEEGDDLKDQNQLYSSRTSMRIDALKTGDFSLNLRKPRLSDSGNYTCIARTYGQEQTQTIEQLEVKVSVKTLFMDVHVGVQSVLLPCVFGFVTEDTTVMWSRSDLSPSTVHQRLLKGDELKNQNQIYSGRTSMRPDALKTGDLSLNLTDLKLSDTGIYTCSVTVFQEEQRRTEVHLQVKEPVSSDTVVLGVLFALFLCISVVMTAVCLILKRKVPQVVEADSGVESVQLPCKIEKLDRLCNPFLGSRLPLPKDIRVEWINDGKWKVHVYENGSKHHGEQARFYRPRTWMNENLLKTKDFSLNLKYPTDRDRGTYTCTVYNREGKVLLKKDVVLQLKVKMVVEVDSGVRSVQLPCRTTVDLSEDVRVEWRINNRKVHVYQNGSDHHEDQDKLFKDRTEMKRDLLESGDLSLTLKYPALIDSNIYTCVVYRHGNILMKKKVKLCVGVPQVEVEEGVRYVQLPFITTSDLSEDVKVEWKRHAPTFNIVHVNENDSDQPEKQDEVYKGRTEMKTDPLKTGDLSLILKNPTVKDEGQYVCRIQKEGMSFMKEKAFLLRVKAQTPGTEEAPLIQCLSL